MLFTKLITDENLLKLKNLFGLTNKYTLFPKCTLHNNYCPDYGINQTNLIYVSADVSQGFCCKFQIYFV